MHCYKLTIAYEGTRYSGWQVQTNALSIQQLIQEALQTLLKEEHVSVIGSGRTDAGVHALGQVAHFKWMKPLNTQKVLFSLNGLLPRDIRIKSLEEADSQFHAQHSALGKEYHYFLYLDQVMDPFRRHYCWHVHHKLNIPLLKEAAKLFLGEHDFTTFTNQAHRGSAAIDPVRTIYRLDVCPMEGGLRLEFEGNGFLYKMVRNIVGTLIEVSSGKRAIEVIPALFTAKDRKLASSAAPPQGLFLIRVNY